MQTTWKWTAEEKPGLCYLNSSFKSPYKQVLWKSSIQYLHLPFFFCCTQSLDQAYSCSSISWLPQFTIPQAQGSFHLAILLHCLQGLSTVLSELTYWWRPSMSGLVYTSYKRSPPENAGDVLWFHMFHWESICSDGKMPVPWRALHGTRFEVVPIGSRQVKEALPLGRKANRWALNLTCHLVETGGNENHPSWLTTVIMYAVR